MKIRILILLTFLAIILPFTVSFAADEGTEPVLEWNAEKENSLTAMQNEDDFIVLKVPLFSPQFTQIPIALVNGEPIVLGEVAAAIAEEKDKGTAVGSQDVYQRILNRLVDSRLIVQEARNIGLDETAEFTKKVENFRLKLLLKELVAQQLVGLEPDPADVEELYRKLSREVKLYSITFTLPADANAFRSEVENADFKELAEKYIAEGKAQGELAEQYVRIKDLRPQVAQQIYSMENGGHSITFRIEEGYLIFLLVDSRFVEDPSVRGEAYDIVMDSFRKQKAMEYSQTLEKKYVDFDEELYEQLDFDADFKKLKDDQRVLVKIKGDAPEDITVGDLVSHVNMGFFHGAEKASSLQMLNKKKEIALANMIFRRTGELEAKAQGLDQKEDFIRKVKAFERSTLFSNFMNKVILPEVRLTGEEVREYYDEHIDEFSSPVMLRMNSLVFEKRKDAESALDKLRKGADFNWISSNAEGLAARDAEGILPFDQNLMSLTSLPEELQGDTRDAKKGDTLLFAPKEENYFYVLQMQEVYPPEAQPFLEARDEVAKIVFNLKSEEKLNEWVAKLREAYDTEIYLDEQKE